MRSLVASALFALVLGSVASCGNGRVAPHDSGRGVGGDAGGPTSCGGTATSICRGGSSIACNSNGSEGATTTCTGSVCVPNLGCRACAPGSGNCSGNDVQQCRADGSGYDTVTTCDPASGSMCSPVLGRCSSPCADAEANNSYIGCEYWPVPTLNNGLRTQATAGGAITRENFHFAVAVANPGTSPATVTIDVGGANVATNTIAGGALQVIQLPWDERLQPLNDAGTATAAGTVPSAIARNAAYHLVSTAPVTVYQFNPLEYETAGSQPDTRGTMVNSFSNDASLLLPSHALTGNYIVMSRATHLLRRHFTNETDPSDSGDLFNMSPGFFTLVGVSDSSSVDITFTSHVVASAAGDVRSFAPGETGTFTLARGDVLQVTSGAPATCTPVGTPDQQQVQTDIFTIYDIDVYYCQVGDDYDLTGTLIRSSGQLELVSGHNCDFVPANRWACDHLEEGIFPLETWGNSALVAVTQPIHSEPNVIRIVSGDDGNAISFDPASVHAGLTLNRGQFVEFEASQSFRATGTESISVAQFLVGQDYAGIGTAGTASNGDPSLSLAIPTEQYRSSYTFLAPPSYAISFVGVSAPDGVAVNLDGGPISGFAAVGGTGFSVANVSISGGVHTISSASPFGIVVYGFGSYTSYMYPGGLDLQRINMPF